MKKILLLIILFLSYTSIAFASDVSIVVPKNIHQGDHFSATITLNTNGVPINSFDITISYPQDIVTFSGYKEENSVRKLWLIPPTQLGNTIHFSGIIPGGVDGLYNPDKKGLQDIVILQLLFEAHTSGTGQLSIDNSDILKNDGHGSALTHENRNAVITVLHGDVSSSTSNDKRPPEQFHIEYIKESFFSATPSIIVFSTTDAESGVKVYQQKINNNEWKDVISPLEVERSLFEQTLTIRALDYSGNSQESTIRIAGLVSNTFLIVSCVIVCCLVIFVIKRRRRNTV